ncbi:MAG: hypothetical protein WBG92_03135, partial [Thiohalocapsa sp.]
QRRLKRERRAVGAKVVREQEQRARFLRMAEAQAKQNLREVRLAGGLDVPRPANALRDVSVMLLGAGMTAPPPVIRMATQEVVRLMRPRAMP